jgi:hypothetical protein
MTERFRPNIPKVAHEAYENEVIIINLESGHYYNTDRAGADVWNGIEKGLDLDALVADMADKYDGDKDQMKASILGFIEQLKDEDLIVPANGPLPQVAAGGNIPHAVKVSFETPRLNKYSDMQELLLLDPIHDVDATGWPNRPS